ncbi:MAG: hypothetical protein GQ547_04930 [Methylophaga sp.]|nr:hypothetical protein [Methylophaga sp.]
MIEIATSNTGLIVGRDMTGFLSRKREKSGKNRTLMSTNTFKRNVLMLELAMATGSRPICGPDGKPVIYINTPFIPPKWRDTTDKLRAIYYQSAIELLAERNSASIPYRLTFNLTPDFTRKAMKEGGLSIIHDKLSKRLKRIGCEADFWLAIEAVIKNDGKSGGWNRFKGRPHIHGSILLTPEQKEIVCGAIRTINGPANTIFKRNETRLLSLEDEKGGGKSHAKYCLKHVGWNKVFMPHTNTLSRTQRIGQVAKELYEQDRTSIKMYSAK